MLEEYLSQTTYLKDMNVMMREYETIDADAMIRFFKDPDSEKNQGQIPPAKKMKAGV